MREDLFMSTPRKLTADDLWSFKEMGNIALSPDGRRVAFTMFSLDKVKNERHGAIYLLKLDEQGQAVGEPRQLTSGLKNDTNPVWAPDSRRLLFLSDREEDKNQLWLINTDGGEARKLTNMFNGVSEAAWSPDGQWIAFTAMVSPTDDEELLTGRKTLDEAEKKKREEEERIRLRSTTKIWYRVDGRGFLEKFNQLFVMPAPVSDTDVIDATTIRRLTMDEVDHNQPAWLPDSTEISVLRNLAEDRDRSEVADLWVVNRETAEARRITDGTLTVFSYAWSPDGRQVMLVASQDMRIEGSCIERLYLVSRGGGEIQNLTANVDNPVFPEASADFGLPGPYRPQWSPDGECVYFVLTELGCVNVYRMDLGSKSVKPVSVGEHLVYFLALFPDESGLLLVREMPLRPWELYSLLLVADGAGEPIQISHLYDDQLADLILSEPERIRYRGSNNDEIEGWIIRPAGARAEVRYPLLLAIHGGPQWAFGVGMDSLFQYFAAQGFAVFYCNPHGSMGYGQTFMREVEGDWGGWDFQDIMLGVDECVERGIADPERMVVTGYSYGGYMSMYTIGQTDRFKAAVPMAGISNLVSFVGTSDLGFWQALQAKGYSWDLEREAYYRERSPLTYAARVTTPTMFLHPEYE